MTPVSSVTQMKAGEGNSAAEIDDACAFKSSRTSRMTLPKCPQRREFIPLNTNYKITNLKEKEVIILSWKEKKNNII